MVDYVLIARREDLSCLQSVPMTPKNLLWSLARSIKMEMRRTVNSNPSPLDLFGEGLATLITGGKT